MTVTVDWGHLNDALKTVSPVTGRGGTLPIFTGVRIGPALDGLELCCTDGDLTITVHVDTVGTLQSTVVPARLFASYVGTLRGDVILTQDDADLVVSCDKTQLSMRTMCADDFPQTAVATGTPFTLTPEVRAQLSRIVYAASRDDARPILCGVAVGDGHIVCTDSYRLAAVSGIVDMPKCIIPARVVELALQLGATVLSVDEQKATFTSDTVAITTRLIAGTYPNWQTLVPADTPHHITVEKDTLLAAVKRVGVLVRDTEPVRLQVVDGDLQLSVHTRDVGEAVETIPCDSDFDGVIAFNGKFLQDMLKATDESKIVFGMQDTFKPAVVKFGGTVSLLMPVRVS